MTENEFKYWAFLGYSPQDNRERRSDTPEPGCRCWGHWLHDALKTFSIPAEFVGQVNGRGEIIPERIEPVFHAEQAEDASLSAEIRQALEQSRCLIVICSPRSAQNLQLNETVRYFKQLGRGKNILPIVVAGEPNVGADSQPNNAQECFVPALRHPVRPDGTLDTARRAGKSIFVDARHGVEKREILAADHRHAEADLEMAKIQLIALLLGVGFNGLWWREQKRHFFDLAAAQDQARKALNQVEEAQRQLLEAQNLALEKQNLPRDVQGQIQEAQNQTREAQKQLHEFQNKVRDTQSQLEDARNRALVAEGKVLEAQNQAREAQNQLETIRLQPGETQNQVLETHNLPAAVSSRIQEAEKHALEAQHQAQSAQSQLEEARNQAQAAQDKLIESQSQVQEFQSQAKSAQSQLEDARNQVRAAQSLALEAQNHVQEIQNQTRDARSQNEAVQNRVQTLEKQGRNARRLTRVFAVLAALALLTAGTVTSMAWRQRKVANQALAKAAAAAAGKFDPAPDGVESIRQQLQNIGGAEQAENRRRSLDQLAAGIPSARIAEALKLSSLIVNDEQRSHFQKWLLIRLGWLNPISAMTCASTIEGKIVNDDGSDDSGIFFQLAVLDNWMQTDLSEALNWVCALPEAEARQRGLEKIIRWMHTQPDSESNNKALMTGIAELEKTDVSQALMLADSLPEGAGRSKMIARLWIRTDPFAVCEWINSLFYPPEIMQPIKASWSGNPFQLNLNFGTPIFVPVKTEKLSNTTNAPIQIKPTE